MRVSFFLTALSLLSASALFAQPELLTRQLEKQQVLDSLLTDLLLDDQQRATDFELKKSYHFLYAQSGFAPKTFYAGREVGINQSNLTGNLFYLNSGGLFAGVSGAWYSQLDPKYSTTLLSAGYFGGLSKASPFNFSLSGNYVFFNTNDPAFEPIYSGSLNLGAVFKTGSVGARVNTALMIGKETGFQASASLFARLTLLRFGKNSKLNFEPELSFYLASEAVDYDSGVITVDPLTGIPTTIASRDQFGLLNTELNLPLRLYLRSFDLEVGWINNFPHSLDENLEYPATSGFQFSIGYIFGW